MASKLSYMHHIGDEPLLYTTIGSLVEATATAQPFSLAIVAVEQNKQLTYRDLLEEADTFAAGLKKLGMQKGDRLGLWLPNFLEWFVIKVACARLGLILVAINPGNKALEMTYSINKVGCKMIICPLSGKYHNYYDIMTEVAPELKTCQPGKLSSANVPTLKTVILVSDDQKSKGVYLYKDVMKMADPKAINEIKNSQHLIQPDDPFCVQFSSGTTGLPKAAVASHFHIINSARETGKRFTCDKRQHKICLQVPFFHIFGLTLGLGVAINFGATMVIPSIYYSPRKNLKAIKDRHCTIIYGTPTMYVDLINVQKQTNDTVQTEIIVTAGAACTPELFLQMKQIFKAQHIRSVYGLTENAGAISQSLSIDEDEFKVRETIGHVTNHVEVKVIDKNGFIVPLGVPGELCVRGFSTMLEYWGDEEKTREAIDRDRWLKTGDQVILREDGYMVIVGRIKDVIIRGGENLFPKEIEDYVNAHPDILEVHVIGLPHERLGEEVCACVKLRNGTTITPEDIAKFLSGKIAHTKIPTHVRVVQDFPKTASGKIQKFKLKEQFASTK